MRAIADTGLLVAFANHRDAHHRWAINLLAGGADPLLTCEAVLAETVFHTGSADVTFGMVQDGLIRPAFRVVDHIDYLIELAKRYADRSPDFADLCLDPPE